MSVVLKINESAIFGVDISAEDAVFKTAVKTTANVKSLAAVDKGQMRNGVQYNTGDGKSGGLNDGPGEQAPGRPIEQAKKLEAYVGDNVEQTLYQEFGTRYQPAQPFIRPGAQLTLGRDAGEIARALNRRYVTEAAKIKERKKTL